MKDLKNRLFTALSMFIVAVVFIFLLNSIVSDALSVRLFDSKNWSSYYGFTIQNIMWIAFFITLGELFYRFKESIKVDKSLDGKHLPEDRHTVLCMSDMSKLSQKLKDTQYSHFDLIAFIRKLVIQFQTSHSIEQTQNMLNSQLEMRSASIDTDYSMIRYLVWFIPTLGFIGTVVGVADALAYAGAVNGEGDKFVAELTAKLAVAFDTTLVALIMSAILVFIMHLVQNKEEKNLVNIGQYCLDNFINRLYIKG
jgi:biopolymer transport protein ExbB/TolQ